MEILMSLRQLPPFASDLFKLITWLLLLLIIFVPLERFCGRRRQKVVRKDFFTDLVYYFVNSFFPKLLLVLPMSLLAGTFHHIVPVSLYSSVANLSLSTRFAAAVFIGEIGSYWGHRWMHEVPFLWRFHAIHHSAEEMDWLVNTRAHPLDLVFTRFCGLVPIYLLGLVQPVGDAIDWVPMVYALVGSLWGFFIHANVRGRFGYIEQLISTPAFHHWHHAKDGATYLNKNYAALLPCMDRIFGTFHLPKQHWPVKYGIDAPLSSSLTEQLLQPFKRRDSAITVSLTARARTSRRVP